jgi:hypothetical protein
VENQAQLSWEARFGRLAAAGAFAAILFQIASFAIQTPALADAPGRNDPLRFRLTLLNFHDNAGVLLGSAVTQAIGTFLAAGALFYLFRATRHRRSELPKMVQWLLLIAPVLITVAVIANWAGLKSASDTYTAPGGTSGQQAKLTNEQRKDIADYCRRRASGTRAVQECRAIRGRQEAVAKKLVEDNQGAVGAAALFGGTIALAFSYVIIALNAMRAGLLSRFMGILGIIVGALIVLPLLPQQVPIVQIFWLGALGILFLGKWPGGRGPAWESGEATPWPTPQARAGLPERGGSSSKPESGGSSSEPEPEGEPEPEEEPAKPHPVSKRRKRKRRR